MKAMKETWKRRRSRSVAEARMRIGKTQFSSLHQPVWRLACIISLTKVAKYVAHNVRQTLTSFREALSSCVAKISPSQSSQSTLSRMLRRWGGGEGGQNLDLLKLFGFWSIKSHNFLENWISLHLHDHGGTGDGLNVGDKGDRLLLPGGPGAHPLQGHLLLLYCLLAFINVGSSSMHVLIFSTFKKRLTCELKIIELTFLSPSW